MVKRLFALGLLAASPAAAQDLSPALDPVQLGQGLTLSATMRAQAERDARRLRGQPEPSSRSIQTCRNARRMERPRGARGAKFDQLLYLCRQIGY